MRIVLPWPEKILWANRSSGRHWAASRKAKDAAKQSGYYLTKEAMKGAVTDPYLRLTIIPHPPDNRRRDYIDNFHGALKHYLDGVSMALGVDDSRFILDPKRGEVVKGGAVVVEISPVDKLELVPFKK